MKFIIHFEEMENQPIKDIMSKVMDNKPSIVIVENDGVNDCRNAYCSIKEKFK